MQSQSFRFFDTDSDPDPDDDFLFPMPIRIPPQRKGASLFSSETAKHGCHDFCGAKIPPA
ncbi:hypothetical protein JXA32_02630 [Candidatus Sumerlaeota bacterium]|nr:hypothetical protein [Candidatus Sumerlaeota bacterium]